VSAHFLVRSGLLHAVQAFRFAQAIEVLHALTTISGLLEKACRVGVPPVETERSDASSRWSTKWRSP